MKIIVHWLILTLAVLATPYIVHGIHVSGFVAAIVVAAILGFINTVVKPVITLLTLPINIITLGLFSLVINGLILWFVATLVVGFSVDSITAAIWGALVISILNWIVNKAFGDK